MTPGSKEAQDAGCICPVLDNARGRGFPVDGVPAFWITDGCPVHAAPTSPITDDRKGR